MATEGIPSPVSQAIADEVVALVVGGHHKPAQKTDLGLTPGASVVASRQVLGGDVHALVGWSVREPTNAGGVNFRLHDGNSAGGEVISSANLLANESIRDIWIPRGIRVGTGRIWLEIITGTVEGVIYWI